MTFGRKTLVWAVGLTGASSLYAENWQPFTETGTFAIQYVGDLAHVQNHFLANPLALGGSDWGDVQLKKDYAPAYAAWNVTNEDGKGAMSFRNTQGGKNSGDLIIFKSQIRTFDNAHFDIYKNNQTFQIFRDMDVKDAIVCAVKSNYEANRYWVASSSAALLSFANTTRDKAKHFKLVPLYRHKDMEKAVTSADSILLDVEKTYPEDLRENLTAAEKEVKALMARIDNTKDVVDPALSKLEAAFLEFKLAGKIGEVADLGDLTAYERAHKKSIALSGDLTAEDFRILRDEMLSLENLDLSGTSLTVLPDFALAGHWKLRQVKLPAGCTRIGKGALMKCACLTDINLEQVTEYGTMALSNTALKTVKIGAGVTLVGDYAFDGCRQLSSIEVDGANACYSSVDGVLFDKKQTLMIKCPEAKTGLLKLPETLVEVKDFACSNSKKLSGNLVLPAMLQKIGAYGFDNCQNLEGALVFPEKLTSLGDAAFSGCWNIEKSLVLPENVTVGTQTFGYMHKVADLTLPVSLDELPQALFLGCKGIKQISTTREIPAKVGAFALSGIDLNFTFINVPESALPAYRQAEGWKDFQNYNAAIEAPSRFATSGKYYIQYVGKGKNENLFMAFNTNYGAKALLTSLQKAPLWELDFFKGNGAEGSYKGGEVADLRYTAGADYKHVNMQGQCYTDAKSGYQMNDNRQFAFWLNEKDGTVAIQSNGYYFTGSATEPNISTVSYKGMPRPADYVFKLIPESELNITVQISDLNYATFYAAHPMMVPAGVKAYTGEVVMDNSTLKLTEMEKVIPAKTAVVLQALPGDYVFSFSTEKGNAPVKNDLKGTLSPMATPENAKVYTLQKIDNETGFYLFTGQLLQGGKAYLELPESVQVNGLVFDTGEVTGIGNVETANDAKVYDLSGRQVLCPVKGLYIINGQKVYVK